LTDKIETALAVTDPRSHLVSALIKLGVHSELMERPRLLFAGQDYEAYTLLYGEVQAMDDPLETVDDLAAHIVKLFPDEKAILVYSVNTKLNSVRLGMAMAGRSSREFSGAVASGTTGAVSIKNKPFINESENEFTDISSEASRTYNFGQKGFVKITNPLKLSVSSSGGHRIFDAQGRCHYIPSGWIHLAWTAKSGQPNFVK
jgi:hypothetical protein